MKKSTTIIAIFLSITLFLLAGCSSTKTSQCKDGCIYEANYICDMTCEECGITYKKLLSNNSLLKEIYSIDYADDASEIFDMINKMYQYLSDTYTEDETKKNMIVIKMKELNTTLTQKYYEFLMNDDYDFRGMCENSIYGTTTWYDKMLETRDKIYLSYENLMADICYSPIGKDVFEEIDTNDPEIAEWLGSYKTNRYTNTQEEDDDSQTTSSRIDTLYNEIMQYDYTTNGKDSYYALANEYFTLLNATTPQTYNNYYEYSLARQNGNKISLEKAKEYFNYFKTSGSEYFNKLKSSIDKNKYSDACALVKMYSTPGKNFNGVNFMQTVVEYLKTLKNDQMNAFDIVNDAYKNGYIFYGTDAKGTGSKTTTVKTNDRTAEFIVYIAENNICATTQVHEIGHYLDKHAGGAVLNEFTSTTQEYLFSAYYFNNYNATSKAEKETMKKDIVYEEYRTALYYALYEEIAHAIFSNYSNIDTMFEDGITVNEYDSFFNKMYAKYGIENSDIDDYKYAIQHIMWGCGYSISYVVNILYGINTFIEAVDNYNDIVSKYMNYLSCDGTNTTLTDMQLCGFTSPLDSIVFTNTITNLDKLLSK